MQEAYGDWITHQLECAICHDLDAPPCQTAAELRHAWEALAHSAARKVADPG
ncbi:hypothetical protein [Streptomyces flavofungini]|uniref:hypothetical protein n=1 Tax=Streptomyces flavofungini TaxID=68200 RepID=UPI0034DE6989